MPPSAPLRAGKAQRAFPTQRDRVPPRCPNAPLGVDRRQTPKFGRPFLAHPRSGGSRRFAAEVGGAAPTGGRGRPRSVCLPRYGGAGDRRDPARCQGVFARLLPPVPALSLGTISAGGRIFVLTPAGTARTGPDVAALAELLAGYLVGFVGSATVTRQRGGDIFGPVHGLKIRALAPAAATDFRPRDHQLAAGS
jgi:hypothetical protein